MESIVGMLNESLSKIRKWNTFSALFCCLQFGGLLLVPCIITWYCLARMLRRRQQCVPSPPSLPHATRHYGRVFCMNLWHLLIWRDLIIRLHKGATG